MGSHVNLEAASEAFYKVLFERAPELESKFNNLSFQRQMFEGALKYIEIAEEQGEDVETQLRAIGLRHRGQNISSEHMAIGREAFQAALSAGGVDDPAAIETFMNGYDAVQSKMKISI
ncbi:globin [Magnetovibrio sp. PR-2]|uniref:globin n=1 Tax=Magnetovibrio sp. PR-2 TaxID=3120356 RepID=UPI002FCE2361